MTPRRPGEGFCWEVTDDERPVPLAGDLDAEASLATGDDPDDPSSVALTPRPNEAPETATGNLAGARVGWSGRFTACTVAAGVVAFGLGWAWSGSGLLHDDAAGTKGSDSSSTYGNAKRQEWKERRDD